MWPLYKTKAKQQSAVLGDSMCAHSKPTQVPKVPNLYEGHQYSIVYLLEPFLDILLIIGSRVLIIL